jgi:hypothetical protein
MPLLNAIKDRGCDYDLNRDMLLQRHNLPSDTSDTLAVLYSILAIPMEYPQELLIIYYSHRHIPM